MKGIRVLLVDDEQAFVEPLAKRLTRRGFLASTALSGEEALSLMKKQDFDVVILDIVMPGLDGIETLQEIKKLRPLIEVVMLSGHGTVESAIKGMQFGAFDFLVKPPEMGELIDKIDKAFARKSEHENRIRSAGFAQRETDGAVEENEDAHHGRMVVIGRHSDFPAALIEYALGVAKRMSYEVVALNAAGFDGESFRHFPEARERVCKDFREISEKNSVIFQSAAREADIRFCHVVKFCSDDDALQELRQEVGEIDYVVCECNEDTGDPAATGHIVAYTPV